MKKSKAIITLVVTLLVTAALGYVAICGIGSEKAGAASQIKQGLDLAGGVSITYQVVGDEAQSSEDMVGKRFLQLDSPLAEELVRVPMYQAQTVRLNDANIYKCTHSSFVDRGFHHQFYLIETLTQEVFKAEKKAYEKVMAQGDSAVTDDAMMLETAFGEQVRVIEGSYQNLKITTPEDIMAAELYLNRKSEKKC